MAMFDFSIVLYSSGLFFLIIYLFLWKFWRPVFYLWCSYHKYTPPHFTLLHTLPGIKALQENPAKNLFANAEY